MSPSDDARSERRGAASGDSEETHRLVDSTAVDPHAATLAVGRGAPTTGVRDLDLGERYEVLELLGEGGMGRVVKARDLALNRPVAIKTIRSPDPELVRRFLLEAENQARIEHANVCRVYEVGEVGGVHFICMQLIEGTTLDRAATEMNLEEILAVVREVAVAVHEAHRLGIIHRDLKPANVLVERDRHGRCRAYVTDFGLARVQSAAGLTTTGMIMGTPAYMSPEQAAGEVHTLDRRTDVYSLGATLYALLAGQPPVGNVSGPEALTRLLSRDPPPLRTHVRSVPSDVETMVMKCLETERDRRYDSLRALADDLGRYLDGDPIHARPASLGYRLLKAGRKHRGIVAAAAAGLLVAVLLLTALVDQRRRSRAEAEVAREVGLELTLISKILDHAYSTPLHDVREEEDRVLERLEGLRRGMEGRGREAVGPVRYALGRGLLLLGASEEALVELDAAWNAGYRLPEVAYARGEARLALLREAQNEIARLPDEGLRESRYREADERLGRPALADLRAATGADVDSIPLLEARLAYLDGRKEDALKAAERAVAEKAWIYPAYVLAAQIHRETGDRLRALGEFEAGRAAFDRAETALETAALTARSEPRIALEQCDLSLARVLMQTRAFADRTSTVAAGAEHCRRALVARPDDAEAWVKLSELHWRRGEFLFKENGSREKATETIEASLAAARAALDLDAELSSAANAIAIAHRIFARDRMNRDEDPEPELMLALEASDVRSPWLPTTRGRRTPAEGSCGSWPSGDNAPRASGPRPSRRRSWSMAGRAPSIPTSSRRSRTRPAQASSSLPGSLPEVSNRRARSRPRSRHVVALSRRLPAPRGRTSCSATSSSRGAARRPRRDLWSTRLPGHSSTCGDRGRSPRTRSMSISSSSQRRSSSSKGAWRSGRTRARISRMVLRPSTPCPSRASSGPVSCSSVPASIARRPRSRSSSVATRTRRSESRPRAWTRSSPPSETTRGSSRSSGGCTCGRQCARWLRDAPR